MTTDDYMYLSTDYQPIAPEVPGAPGAPGLWLDIGGEVSEWQGGVMRVFTRITTGPALWLYQGQYEIKVSKSLTLEEWQRQKVSVRKTWAKELVRKGWGQHCQILIYARKHLGRLPTKAE
ncbi:hypothetical protein DFP72DRAFT_1174203 [Ephemerocybe angulata]|uniref:DUF6697 domain-containing protein n=1 Tax=Ephemerocybe angulata TaxID=980116 RepID=A0A8H6M1U2_9AGAR|nr:hypothetical protein DFP72DRAFT_1174203 [Tulosesus angulatus]